MPSSVAQYFAGQDVERFTSKSITFDGSAGSGAIGVGTVFAVTGTILLRIMVPQCTTNIGVDGGSGAATIQLGTTNDTDFFVGGTVPTVIDSGDFWTSTP